jgi:hypothetical protein
MSDPSGAVTIPSLATSVAHSLAQKAGTMVATALLAAGLIPNAEFDKDQSLIAGVALLALSVAWSYARDWYARRRAVDLANGKPAVTK